MMTKLRRWFADGWRATKYNGHYRDHIGWSDLIDGRDCYCWDKR